MDRLFSSKSVIGRALTRRCFNSEELNRSENAMLKPLVAKLKDIKTTVDEKNAANGQGPISWADLLVLTARLAVSKEWRVQKVRQHRGIINTFIFVCRRGREQHPKKMHSCCRRHSVQRGQ